MTKTGNPLQSFSAGRAVRFGRGRAPGGTDRLRDMSGFGANPGGLRARTYVPDSLAGRAPLVVVLHGCTQTAAGYDHGAGWSRLADEHGFALLFPEQQAANNPNRCFNWFVPEHVRRGGGEVESIRQMVVHLVAEHDLDPARIFVTGLSAGGAMTMALLACYPELFAGGAVIAGLPFGTASTMPEAFQRMRGQERRDAAALGALVREASPHRGPWPILSVWHGDADTTVNPDNGARIVDQWRSVHGLPPQPDRTERLDGQARRAWLGPDGRVVLEEVIVAGMDHGTPLSTAGPAGVGHAAPFMLEAGISSTRHIAHFWGLAETPVATDARPARAAPQTPVQTVLPPLRPEAEAASRAPANPYGEAFIKSTIEDAFRAAGLMR